MRAGDLAEAEAINPTLLSRVLGHLEEAGLVARGADPEDARCTLVSATPAGTRLLGLARRGAPRLDVQREHELAIVDLNVRSTVHLAKHVVQHMVARDDGRILFHAG